MPEPLILIPAGIPLAVMAPLGDLLDAALGGGSMLGVGKHPGVSSELRARDDLPTSEIADRLRAAAAAVRGESYTPAPDPGDDVDGLELGRLREGPDGTMSVGVSGPTAEDHAKTLLAAFLPALDAAGATNYLHWDAVVPGQRDDDGTYTPPQRFAIIVCRPGGRTPHELRQDAEARVAELEQQLAELQADGDAHRCSGQLAGDPDAG